MIGRTIWGLVLCLSAGCAFDAEDLDNWKRVAKGEERLTGYLADTTRPVDLRAKAADALFEMGAIGSMFTAVDALPAADRSALLELYVVLATKYLEGEAPVEAGRAARVLFEVLRRHKDLPDAPAAAATLADWALLWFANADPPPTDVSLEDLIQAAAVVQPDVVRPKLATVTQEIKDERVLLRLNQVLSALRDPQIEAGMAAALLERARASYPDVSLELAEAMVNNRNPVLLRFLLEAARDPRVAPGVRNLGVRATARHLGADGLDGLFRLVATDDPSSNNLHRLNAIDLIWKFGGVPALSRLLQALPDTGWPEKGGGFKDEVDGFCDKLASASAQVRLPLVDALVAPNWAARAYAMECVIRLYPDDASIILEGLAQDPTPLPGWSEAGPTTIGDVVRAVREG